MLLHITTEVFKIVFQILLYPVCWNQC